MTLPTRPAMSLLDPKLDIVFKLLFTREPALLRAMLQAILREPISSLRVLNPNIPGELHDDKGIVLDVRVELANGKRVDVEMQMRAGPAFAERRLYYGARDYASQLQHGDDYDKLTPTVLVVWLVEPLFREAGPLHTIFELRERTSGRLLTAQLAIHLLELAKFHWPGECDCTEERDVLRWARFLVARTEEELSRLALEDPIMQAAKDALVSLSQDPEVSRLARERADSVKLYAIEIAENRREAFQQGIHKGLLESVKRHLKNRFGSLPESAEGALAAATVSDLERIDEAVFDADTLDEVLALVRSVTS